MSIWKVPEERATEIEKLDLKDRDIVVLLMKAGAFVEMDAFNKFLHMVDERLKVTQKKVALLAMTDDIDLKVLDDEQLKSIGLARVAGGS